MNTVVLEKNQNGEEIPVNVFAKMTKSRVLYLTGNIDEQQATDIVATLLYLRSQSAKDPTINIFMNAYSSDVRSVLMISDFIKTMDVPVRVVCTGESLGAATVLLAVADDAQATKSSIILFGPVPLFPGANKVSEAENFMKRAKSDQKKMFTLVAKKINKSIKETTDIFSKNVYMSTKEALQLGIIDSIVEENK